MSEGALKLHSYTWALAQWSLQTEQKQGGAAGPRPAAVLNSVMHTSDLITVEFMRYPRMCRTIIVLLFVALVHLAEMWAVWDLLHTLFTPRRIWLCCQLNCKTIYVGKRANKWLTFLWEADGNLHLSIVSLIAAFLHSESNMEPNPPFACRML